mmetsp:Transcript_10945/g.15210  ORF Transcript_10945/g.15210 Transcript_10945/m.15210 type:complete len:366 (-) Transcript_10945:34-1131(-)
MRTSKVVLPLKRRNLESVISLLSEDESSKDERTLSRSKSIRHTNKKKRSKKEKRRSPALRDIANEVNASAFSSSWERDPIFPHKQDSNGINKNLGSIHQSSNDTKNDLVKTIRPPDKLLELKRKIPIQEKRNQIRTQIEAKYAERSEAEKLNEVSKAICAHALRRAEEELDAIYAALTAKLESSTISEDEIESEYSQFLRDQKTNFDEFVATTTFAQRRRHWKCFEDIAKQSFTDLKVDSMEKLEKNLRKSTDQIRRQIQSVETITKDITKATKKMKKKLKALELQILQSTDELKSTEADIKNKMATKQPNQYSNLEDDGCQICMDQKNETVLSCGHLLCRACSGQLSKCPFCSKEIKFIIMLRE